MNALKEKFKNGGCSYGTMIGVLDSPDLIKILSNNGFEWFFYDAEHGYPNPDRLNAIFAYARMMNIHGFLRIPETNKTEVFRALDMGVDGIINPNVETIEHAKELVRLAKYAPNGERGISMTRPHTDYRTVNGKEYMKQANEDIFLIPQIESVKGVENVDAIVSIPEIDGVLIGPSDLSRSLGDFGNYSNPVFQDAVQTIFDACKNHNKFVGIVDKDINELEIWRERGAQLLQWGSEVSLLVSAIKSGLPRNN